MAQTSTDGLISKRELGRVWSGLAFGSTRPRALMPGHIHEDALARSTIKQRERYEKRILKLRMAIDRQGERVDAIAGRKKGGLVRYGKEVSALDAELRRSTDMRKWYADPSVPGRHARATAQRARREDELFEATHRSLSFDSLRRVGEASHPILPSMSESLGDRRNPPPPPPPPREPPRSLAATTTEWNPATELDPVDPREYFVDRSFGHKLLGPPGDGKIRPRGGDITQWDIRQRNARERQRFNHFHSTGSLPPVHPPTPLNPLLRQAKSGAELPHWSDREAVLSQRFEIPKTPIRPPYKIDPSLTQKIYNQQKQLLVQNHSKEIQKATEIGAQKSQERSIKRYKAVHGII